MTTPDNARAKKRNTLVGSGLNSLALEVKLRDNHYSLRDRVSETLTLAHCRTGSLETVTDSPPA